MTDPAAVSAVSAATPAPVRPGVRVALFDLDHTLLPHDTQGLLANFVLRRQRGRTLLHLPFLAVAPARVLRLVSTRFLKRMFLNYLWRLPRPQLERLVLEFVTSEVRPRLYPSVLEELERHRREGRTTVLNSASPEFYVTAIGRELGFDHAIGTRVDLGPGPRVRWLPDIDGPNNKRAAKLERMRELLGVTPGEPWPGHDGRPPLEDSWAYSDSAADVPLLRLARHKVLVHPSAEFSAIGGHEGWDMTVLQPPRPYAGETGARLTSLRQAFGLYPPASKQSLPTTS